MQFFDEFDATIDASSIIQYPSNAHDWHSGFLWHKKMLAVTVCLTIFFQKGKAKQTSTGRRIEQTICFGMVWFSTFNYQMRERWRRGGDHSYARPLLTFDRVEIQKIVRKIAKIESLQEKCSQIRACCSKRAIHKKQLFWPNTTYCSHCSSPHTCRNMLMLVT